MTKTTVTRTVRQRTVPDEAGKPVNVDVVSYSLIDTRLGHTLGWVSAVRMPTPTEPYAVIEGLNVIPESRNCGLGARLLDAVLDDLRQHGVTRARLYVARDNAIARHLYTSRGFTSLGHLPNHSPNAFEVTL